MLLLILAPEVMPESEFEILRLRRRELETQLSQLQKHMAEIENKLAETQSYFETQSFFHNPEVVISVYRHKNKPNQWLGRVRVPDKLLPYFDLGVDKRFYISFFICDISLFPDKNSLELRAMAKEAAKNKIKERLSKFSR